MPGDPMTGVELSPTSTTQQSPGASSTKQSPGSSMTTLSSVAADAVRDSPVPCAYLDNLESPANVVQGNPPQPIDADGNDDFDLVISCLRTSGAYIGGEDRVIQLKLQCWRQLQAFYLSVGREMPPTIDITKGSPPITIPGCTLWLISPRTSVNDFFTPTYQFGGQMQLHRGEIEIRLHDYLCRLHGDTDGSQKRRILFLQSGIDGTFTKPGVWRHLAAQFPSFDMHLDVCMPLDALPEDYTDRHNELRTVFHSRHGLDYYSPKKALGFARFNVGLQGKLESLDPSLRASGDAPTRSHAIILQMMAEMNAWKVALWANQSEKDANRPPFAIRRNMIEWQKRCHSCRNDPLPGLTLCQECSDLHNAYLAKRYADRVDQGQCVGCGRAALPGRTKCQECTDRGNIAKKERYTDRADQGQCVICGGAALPGRRLCQECADRENAAAKKKYADRAADRADQGQCVKCGAAALPGRRQCQECIDRKNAQDTKRNSDRAEHGKCSRCGEAALPGKKQCKKCTDGRNAYHKKWLTDKANQGLCSRCGKNPAVPGFKLCQACRDRGTAYKAKVRGKARAKGGRRQQGSRKGAAVSRKRKADSSNTEEESYPEDLDEEEESYQEDLDEEEEASTVTIAALPQCQPRGSDLPAEEQNSNWGGSNGSRNKKRSRPPNPPTEAQREALRPPMFGGAPEQQRHAPAGRGIQGAAVRRPPGTSDGPLRDGELASVLVMV